MPKTSSFTADELTERALQQFWVCGYHATSMDRLVAATAVSRHGIYSTFGGKKKLFLACFDRYRDAIVSPAFRRVESPDADLASVAAFFEVQISSGEAAGLPGPGCFVVNSATEMAPHDAETMAKVAEHNRRLHVGFKNAIGNESTGNGSASDIDVAGLANVFVTFTNGLWSMSRSVTNADDLRNAAGTFLTTMKRALR